jgi:hypothetical protein
MRPTLSADAFDQGATFYSNYNGGGGRIVNGNITGIKIFPLAGVFTGRVTLLGSTN